MDDAYAALEDKEKAATPEQQHPEFIKTENKLAEKENWVQRKPL